MASTPLRCCSRPWCPCGAPSGHASVAATAPPAASTRDSAAAGSAFGAATSSAIGTGTRSGSAFAESHSASSAGFGLGSGTAPGGSLGFGGSSAFGGGATCQGTISLGGWGTTAAFGPMPAALKVGAKAALGSNKYKMFVKVAKDLKVGSETRESANGKIQALLEPRQDLIDLFSVWSSPAAAQAGGGPPAAAALGGFGMSGGGLAAFAGAVQALATSVTAFGSETGLGTPPIASAPGMGMGSTTLESAVARQAVASAFGAAPQQTCGFGAAFGSAPAAASWPAFRSAAGPPRSLASAPAIASGPGIGICPKWTKTQGPDGAPNSSCTTEGTYMAITAMQAYQNCSFEELRVQDYEAGRNAAKIIASIAERLLSACVIDAPATGGGPGAAGNVFGDLRSASTAAATAAGAPDLADACAVSAIVRGMGAHAADRRVQEHACQALSGLMPCADYAAWQSITCAHRLQELATKYTSLAAHGVIPALLQAMSNHKDSAIVACEAGTILGVLARSDDNIRLITLAGGISRFIETMPKPQCDLFVGFFRELSPKCADLCAGDRVSVHGIIVMTQLNGKLGVVSGVKEGGMVAVTLQEGGSVEMFHCSNLKKEAAGRVDGGGGGGGGVDTQIATQHVLTGALAAEGNTAPKWVPHNFTLETMFQRLADGRYWKSKVVNGVLTFEKVRGDEESCSVLFARLAAERLEAERLRERVAESEREREAARLKDLQAAAAHAAARLPERLRDPAVFQAELAALSTTLEGLVFMVDGARCHYANPRVQAAVLVALKQLIRGGNDEAKKNGQTEADSNGKLFEKLGPPVEERDDQFKLGALSTATQAGDTGGALALLEGVGKQALLDAKIGLSTCSAPPVVLRVRWDLNLRVRLDRSLSSDQVGTLRAGSAFAFSEVGGGWAKLSPLHYKDLQTSQSCGIADFKPHNPHTHGFSITTVDGRESFEEPSNEEKSAVLERNNGTVLHLAAYCNTGGCVVSRLLAIGGQELLDKKTSAGQTARELAAAKSHTNVVAEIDRWAEAKRGAEAEQARKLMPWFESIGLTPEDAMDVAVACFVNFGQPLFERLSAGGGGGFDNSAG